ncbi:hypothetical protein EVAR_28297_1 [Eumeta japonica]|uniref:Uncharacterized protein n=1 Tax=Eumeta variegata TaxID=151549 RepID=A0A4C1V8S1_EUMVA|nr:hypothetical protein EVAR_28297_1 [Eumeta japonica]
MSDAARGSLKRASTFALRADGLHPGIECGIESTAGAGSTSRVKQMTGLSGVRIAIESRTRSGGDGETEIEIEHRIAVGIGIGGEYTIGIESPII